MCLLTNGERSADCRYRYYVGPKITELNHRNSQRQIKGDENPLEAGGLASKQRWWETNHIGCIHWICPGQSNTSGFLALTPLSLSLSLGIKPDVYEVAFIKKLSVLSVEVRKAPHCKQSQLHMMKLLGWWLITSRSSHGENLDNI